MYDVASRFAVDLKAHNTILFIFNLIDSFYGLHESYAAATAVFPFINHQREIHNFLYIVLFTMRVQAYNVAE